MNSESRLRNFFHRPERLVVTITACASLALLAPPAVCSPLTTGFQGPPSHFTENGTTYTIPHEHVDFLFYNLGVHRWLVQLNPDPPEYLARPTDNFNQVLSNKFPAQAGGLQYQNAAAPLSDDSLVVHWYDAVHSGSTVGAEFGVEYVPHGNDPVKDIHWIQVITDSDPENVVDAKYLLTDPYYDDGGVANSSFFRDRPRRGDSSPHSWSAELRRSWSLARQWCPMATAASNCRQVLSHSWGEFSGDGKTSAPIVAAAEACSPTPAPVPMPAHAPERPSLLRGFRPFSGSC